MSARLPFVFISLLLALVLASTPAWSGMRAREASIQSGQSAQAGEHCLLCDRVLEEGDHALLHRGRRVPLCAGKCTDAWNADPDAHFAALQARSALFQESVAPEGPVGSRWFWFAVYMLTGVLSGAGASFLAVNRAVPPRKWFLMGLVGNVFALTAMYFLMPRGDMSELPAGIPSGLRKVPLTRDPDCCEGCRRPLHPSARTCPTCGVGRETSVTSEVERSAR